jgi:hypothetical protein
MSATIEDILIRELVDTICEYLDFNDIVNFHTAYRFPLSIKWIKELQQKLNTCQIALQMKNKSIEYLEEQIKRHKLESVNLFNEVTNLKRRCRRNKNQKKRNKKRDKKCTDCY